MATEHGLPFRTLSALHAYLGLRGENSTSAAHQALALIYHDLLQRAAALSYLDGFRVMAVLLIVVTPFVWIMKKPQFKSSALPPRASAVNSPSSSGPLIAE